MKFVNPEVAAKYRTRAGQYDTEIIVTQIQWQSKLSRITPRVAEIMIQSGTNLIERIPQAERQNPNTKIPNSIQPAHVFTDALDSEATPLDASQAEEIPKNKHGSTRRTRPSVPPKQAKAKP